ncbi:hypothetical protein H2198_001665 [Neophaeococcomyces mojaviensis]|uniref:Uncharacterized protein n=1 Tax=Neophaeococcomyces mojaviensis TaxID=3383035 RepID=A0ACC3AGC4_9EURO|nr:hypothetical protein H2198_001665 [Knufia sp. JES_112]
MPENMISSSIKTPLQELINLQGPITPRRQAPVLREDKVPVWETETWKTAVSAENQTVSHPGKKEPSKKRTTSKKKETPQTIPRTSQVIQRPIVLATPQNYDAGQCPPNSHTLNTLASLQSSRFVPGPPTQNGLFNGQNYRQFLPDSAQRGWSNTGRMNYIYHEGRPGSTGAGTHQYNTPPITYTYPSGYSTSRPSSPMPPIQITQNIDPNLYAPAWNHQDFVNYGSVARYNSPHPNIHSVWADAAPIYPNSPTTAPAAPVATDIVPIQSTTNPSRQRSIAPSHDQSSLSTRKFPQVWADAEALRAQLAPEHIAHHNSLIKPDHPAQKISVLLKAAVDHIATARQDKEAKVVTLEKKLEAARREYAKLKQDYLHVNNLFQEIAQKNNKACDERKTDKATIEKQKEELKELRNVVQKLAEFNYHYLVRIDNEILKKVCHPGDNNWDVPMNTMKMFKGIERFFTTPGMYIGPQAGMSGKAGEADNAYSDDTNPHSGVSGDTLLQNHGQYSPTSVPAAKPAFRKRKASTFMRTASKKTKTAVKLSSASPISTATTKASPAKTKAKPQSASQPLSNRMNEDDDTADLSYGSSTRPRELPAPLTEPTPEPDPETTDEETKNLKLVRQLAFGVGGRTRKRINYAS